jgi:hypothetical protein
MCINVKLFDAIAAHGRGVTLAEAHGLLPQIVPKRVTAAAHRLSIAGALTLKRRGNTITYHAKPDAQPTDKRGRPRITVAPRSEASG